MRYGAFAVLLTILLGCGAPRQEGTGALKVLVSVVPQGYFVERITGGSAEVTVLIPPGASPASYELSPSDMIAVSEADVWFSIGVLAESQWNSEFQELNPELAVVSTIQGIERRAISDHHHGGEEHAHGETDPHVWLSPELVRTQAVNIAAALEDLDPGNSGTYRRNLDDFLAQIDGLQEEMHSILDPAAGSSFMVFHPAWGYFADEFGLEQVAIEVAGSEPTPSEMAELVMDAREEGIRVIFVSPQFSSSSAETIAEETGAGVAVIDPLAEDWQANMLSVARSIAEASP